MNTACMHEQTVRDATKNHARGIWEGWERRLWETVRWRKLQHNEVNIALAKQGTNFHLPPVQESNLLRGRQEQTRQTTRQRDKDKGDDDRREDDERWLKRHLSHQIMAVLSAFSHEKARLQRIMHVEYGKGGRNLQCVQDTCGKQYVGESCSSTK